MAKQTVGLAVQRPDIPTYKHTCTYGYDNDNDSDNNDYKHINVCKLSTGDQIQRNSADLFANETKTQSAVARTFKHSQSVVYIVWVRHRRWRFQDSDLLHSYTRSPWSNLGRTVRRSRLSVSSTSAGRPSAVDRREADTCCASRPSSPDTDCRRVPEKGGDFADSRWDWGWTGWRESNDAAL